jgi:hypothetical protein
MHQQQSSPVSLFYSYAPEDEELRKRLEIHLSSLRREGLISGWHEGLIVPGTDWAQNIHDHLNESSIILLLVSPDFLASDDRYNVEMQRALERHERREARVIPIILRPCDWQQAPFARLQCLPRNCRPITTWRNRDEAFLDIVQGIRQVIAQLTVSLHSTPVIKRSNAFPSLPTSETLPTTYKGHTHFVLSVAWSPDSRYIVSGGADETVRVWHATTLETVQTYSTHFGWFYPSFNPRPYIYVVAWSPNGQLIASAGTGTKMHVWKALTGDTERVYPHPTPFLRFASIHALAWSPNGTRIASICSSDVANVRQKIVRIWDVASGQELLPYPMPTGFSNGALTETSALAWSPDGQSIASTTGDGTIYIWNANTGKQVTTWHVSAALVLAVTWSPKGDYLAVATASGSKSGVIIWSISPKKTILTYDGHNSDVRTIAWSPDGTRIASGSHDETVQVWNAGTGEAIKIFQHHASFVTSVAWSPDGTRIASGSHDRTIRVWQAS